jgi:hypothetical protein
MDRRDSELLARFSAHDDALKVQAKAHDLEAEVRGD